MSALRALDSLSDSILCADAQTETTSVLSQAHDRCATHVAVFDEDRFLGVLSTLEILQSLTSGALGELLVGNECPEVAPSTPVRELDRLLKASKTSALAVVGDRKDFLGVVTQQSLVCALLAQRYSGENNAPGLRRAEEKLADQASRLQAIYDAYPDLQFVVQKDGTIVDWHAGRKSDLYVAPEKFIGKRMQDVLPRDVGRQYEQALAHVSEKGSIVTFEYPLSIGGTDKIFEARIVRLCQQQMMVLVRDVTVCQRFHTLTSISPVGIFQTDAGGKCI